MSPDAHGITGFYCINIFIETTDTILGKALLL
jgi:hypothetical protein